MQNKPNFLDAQTNVNFFNTKAYNNETAVRRGKNKPNSNPISVKPKMSANLYVIEDYENKTAFRPEQNKPNQSQFPKDQNELKIAR